jgi:threonylcarbamoyladenosine tRNA methylthiotransferase MtaB
MPHVAPQAVRERAGRLRAAGAAALDAHLSAQTGKLVRVLTERGGIGKAEDFTRVRTGGAPPSRIIDMKITAAEGGALTGAAVPSAA